MIKKRYFSIDYDFKTGVLCKLFLLIGIIALAISLFFIIVSKILNEDSTGLYKQMYDISLSTIPETILSLSLLSLAVSAIMYFFYLQFKKLSEIAEEIEKEERER